ncbi:MAG: hypothetical protein ABW208_07255 [Pyrinomonadaceae bacterium]
MSTTEATISPFRQDPLSRLYVRVSTALAIVEDGSYGLLKFEDVARLLEMAVGDIDELKLARDEKPEVGINWNEHAAVVAANE